jgi:hypothetical protein
MQKKDKSLETFAALLSGKNATDPAAASSSRAAVCPVEQQVTLQC